MDRLLLGPSGIRFNLLAANTMSDPYNLQRFIDAQETSYRSALAEISAGQKISHWMWYVFPQYHGLGFSSTSRHYAIKSLQEASAYLEHTVLGVRLHECVDALLAAQDRSAHEIFGSPDDIKLRSCATLFAQASPEYAGFTQVLEKYFAGRQDQKTLELIQNVP
jgi:uncharacterized protein (DUF1810 family)